MFGSYGSFRSLLWRISKTFANSEMAGTLPSILIMVLYIALGILYLFPSMFLFRFSANVKLAIQEQSEPQITEALKHLRSFFAFAGIMTIVMLSIFILVLGGGIIVAIIGAMAGTH